MKPTGHIPKRSILTKSGSLFNDNEMDDLDDDEMWQNCFYSNHKQTPKRMNESSKKKAIVDSPPDSAEFDNDALWQGIFTSSQVSSQAKTNKKNNGEDRERIQENALKENFNTTSQRDAFADTLIIPSKQRVLRPDLTKFPATSRKRDQDFSLHELQRENATTESQLIEQVVDAQTPSVENKVKRFKFRKK